LLLQLFKFLSSYILFARTRQKLLYLATFGLIISSFSLLVLQGTMGGLQHKLVERSKKVLGSALIEVESDKIGKYEKLYSNLLDKNFNVIKEYEIELLLRFNNHLVPLLLHGFDDSNYLPFFYQERMEKLLISHEISYKLGASIGDQLEIISPSHVDGFFGDIPRSISIELGDIVSTDVPEVDAFHGWVNIGKVQNLIREVMVNKLRVYDSVNIEEIKKIMLKHNISLDRLVLWEDQHKSLVWALKLESTVMLFLFIAMTILVSFCITSGQLIFFNKIKFDLASFWILGASKNRLVSSSKIFFYLLSFISVLFGVLSAILFLFLLDQFGTEIMPDIFVDRKIPVHITLPGLLISFIVPYVISLFFTHLSLRQFNRDVSFLKQVRSIG
jgi:lipoprotein-releasing system permease protein